MAGTEETTGSMETERLTVAHTVSEDVESDEKASDENELDEAPRGGAPSVEVSLVRSFLGNECSVEKLPPERELKAGVTREMPSQKLQG